MSAEEKKDTTSVDILESPDSPVSLIPLTVSYYGQEFHFELKPNSTVRELKEKLEPLVEVPVENQRLLYKQILPDDMKIGKINITDRRRRVMLTGPQEHNHVLSPRKDLDYCLFLINTAQQSELLHRRCNLAQSAIHPIRVLNNLKAFSQLKNCIKVRKELVELAQKLGKPSDVTRLLNCNLNLFQDIPITGLLDENGRKIRMGIKPDGLYLYTASTTDRYRRRLISEVFVEPIDDSGDYYGLKFRYDNLKHFYVLWIPRQFKDSIKAKLNEPNA